MVESLKSSKLSLMKEGKPWVWPVRTPKVWQSACDEHMVALKRISPLNDVELINVMTSTMTYPPKDPNSPEVKKLMQFGKPKFQDASFFKMFFDLFFRSAQISSLVFNIDDGTDEMR